MKRSAIAKDLRTPKYRMRVIPNQKRRANKLACRKTTETKYASNSDRSRGQDNYGGGL